MYLSTDMIAYCRLFSPPKNSDSKTENNNNPDYCSDFQSTHLT